MSAPMQPDPLDAPDWLVGLLAEHAMAGTVSPSWGQHWVTCRCNWHGPTHKGSLAPDSEKWDALYADHRTHVAAVVWAAITERASGVLPTDWYEHLLNGLGADDD